MGNGKFSKYLAYVFFICLILFFILNGADKSQTWVPIVRNIALYLAIGCGLIYVAIIVYCIIENKKIDNLLNNDKYDELITYATKKANKKGFILENRNQYYNYLLLLSYLAKDDEENSNIYFEKLKGQEFMFPMVSYWKVSYKFSIGEYEEIEDCYNTFRNSKEVAKAPYKYSNLTDLLYSFVLYSKGNIKEAKERLSKLDTTRISMPATIKSIKIIQEAEVVEEVVEETPENQEDTAE